MVGSLAASSAVSTVEGGAFAAVCTIVTALALGTSRMNEPALF